MTAAAASRMEARRLLEIAPGAFYGPGWLDRKAQEALLAEVRAVIAEAPLFTPRMPRTGAPMSVRMTNCGGLGWVTDAAGGYRYQADHPETGRPWPPIPPAALQVWREAAQWPGAPQACLVNRYGPEARMGLHQDRDEEDFTAPVVSISLGDEAVFRLGGDARHSPTRTIRLASGDVFVLSGAARLAFHGVDRIVPDSSTLLAEGGRLNLTLRRVSPRTQGA